MQVEIGEKIMGNTKTKVNMREEKKEGKKKQEYKIIN